MTSIRAAVFFLGKITFYTANKTKLGNQINVATSAQAIKCDERYKKLSLVNRQSCLGLK